MSRACPNQCGRSFREHGAGLAFHLTWCVAPDAVDVAIAAVAPGTPAPTLALVPVREWSIEEPCRAEPVPAVNARPVEPIARKARKAPARKAAARMDGLAVDGSVVTFGPIRVGFVQMSDLPPEGRETADRMLRAGGRGLGHKRAYGRLDIRTVAPVYDALARDPLGPWSAYGPAAPKSAPDRVHHAAFAGYRPVADPLASTPAPVRGWTSGAGTPVARVEIAHNATGLDTYAWMPAAQRARRKAARTTSRAA